MKLYGTQQHQQHNRKYPGREVSKELQADNTVFHGSRARAGVCVCVQGNLMNPCVKDIKPRKNNYTIRIPKQASKSNEKTPCRQPCDSTLRYNLMQRSSLGSSPGKRESRKNQGLGNRLLDDTMLTRSTGTVRKKAPPKDAWVLVGSRAMFPLCSVPASGGSDESCMDGILQGLGCNFESEPRSKDLRFAVWGFGLLLGLRADDCGT